MKFADLLALITLAALWGGSFLFMRIAGPALGPFVTIELRVVLAAIVLLSYAAIIKHRLVILYKWKEFLFIGPFNAALPFVLITTAELTLPASLASILNATTPVFTALIAWIWIKEPFGLKKSIGLVVGIIGVVILVGWSPVALTDDTLISVSFSLLAAFCYGIAGIFIAKSFKGVPSLDLAIGQQLAASLVLFPFAVMNLPTEVPSSAVIISILGLAIFSTALAYLLYFRLVKNIGPVKTLSVTFLVPIFGVLWGYIFLHESIGVSTLIGMAVIFISIIFVVNLGPKFTHTKKQQHDDK